MRNKLYIVIVVVTIVVVIIVIVINQGCSQTDIDR